MVRVLDLHSCDSGSNPTVGRFFFFFFSFFFFFCLSRIRDNRPERVKRRWYIHDKIREFCSEETKDLVCPQPESPCPYPTPPLPSIQSRLESNLTSVLQKRGCVCGNYV